jgi:hypothetical protein
MVTFIDGFLDANRYPLRLKRYAPKRENARGERAFS